MPCFPLLPPVFPFSLGFSHRAAGRGTPQDSASNFPAEPCPHTVAAFPVLRRTKGLPWAPSFRTVPQGDQRHGHRASGQMGAMTVARKTIILAFRHFRLISKLNRITQRLGESSLEVYQYFFLISSKQKQIWLRITEPPSPWHHHQERVLPPLAAARGSEHLQITR